MTGAVSVDAECYHRRAIDLARSAADALAELGVTVLVTGSLARGRFGPNSDIDFLVTSCPRRRKYAIEGVIENILEGLPFDVVYLDEIPAWKVTYFTDGAVYVRHLR
jgi:predicted nucleotidyltransferase